MTEITSTAQSILEKRYFIKGETKWEHLASRVASHFAKSESEFDKFFIMMDEFNALPNSPTLMNAGTDITSFSACFVLPIDDSIESIYKYYKDAALISKSGGGVGANFSYIRAEGEPVGCTGGAASGPISFMKVQDASTETIKQGGRRKGANMSLLDYDHPDIWKFVSAKDTKGELENFNLSVRVSNQFMESLDSDENNKQLWDELCKRAWSSAEPGVVFGDTIEKDNTVPHLGELRITNPCHTGTIQ